MKIKSNSYANYLLFLEIFFFGEGLIKSTTTGLVLGVAPIIPNHCHHKRFWPLKLNIKIWLMSHVAPCTLINLTRNTCMQQTLATKSMQLYFRNYMKYSDRLLS